MASNSITKLLFRFFVASSITISTTHLSVAQDTLVVVPMFGGSNGTLERVQGSSVEINPAASTETMLEVSCPAGKTPISGGLGGVQYIADSYPSSDSTKWIATFTENPVFPNATVAQVRVICIGG